MKFTRKQFTWTNKGIWGKDTKIWTLLWHIIYMYTCNTRINHLSFIRSTFRIIDVLPYYDYCCSCDLCWIDVTPHLELKLKRFSDFTTRKIEISYEYRDTQINYCLQRWTSWYFICFILELQLIKLGLELEFIKFKRIATRNYTLIIFYEKNTRKILYYFLRFILESN